MLTRILISSQRSLARPVCTYCDIDSFCVPVLVDEEVHDIDSVQYVDHDHRPGDAPMSLVLICCPAEVDNGPSDDPRPAVEEEFQVPVLDSWVEFNLGVRDQSR